MAPPMRKGGRKPLSQLAEDTKYRINLAVRRAAVEIANGLAEAGPVWTGEFRDSYRFEAIGAGSRGGSDGKYPYVLANVPQLSTKVRELQRVTKLRIVNTAPHAQIAIDQEWGIFKAKSAPSDPEKTIITGYRPIGGLRGDVENSSGPGMERARATAPLNWLGTFVDGGEMQKRLARGVRIALREG